jgi:phage gp36-like protein
MAYATPADVRDALAPSGDTSAASAAALDDGQLNDAIREATTEVDARVDGAPWDDGEVPKLINDIVRDIAGYLATLTHRKGSPLPAEHPVRLRYVRARELLVELAAGRIELEPDGELTSTEATVVNPYEGDMWDLNDLGLGYGQLR